jgi:hypothetical protein
MTLKSAICRRRFREDVELYLHTKRIKTQKILLKWIFLREPSHGNLFPDPAEIGNWFGSWWIEALPIPEVIMAIVISG